MYTNATIKAELLKRKPMNAVELQAVLLRTALTPDGGTFNDWIERYNKIIHAYITDKRSDMRQALADVAGSVVIVAGELKRRDQHEQVGAAFTSLGTLLGTFFENVIGPYNAASKAQNGDVV